MSENVRKSLDENRNVEVSCYSHRTRLTPTLYDPLHINGHTSLLCLILYTYIYTHTIFIPSSYVQKVSQEFAYKCIHLLNVIFSLFIYKYTFNRHYIFLYQIMFNNNAAKKIIEEMKKLYIIFIAIMKQIIKIIFTINIFHYKNNYMHN